jgi:hypothetical protein
MTWVAAYLYIMGVLMVPVPTDAGGEPRWKTFRRMLLWPVRPLVPVRTRPRSDVWIVVVVFGGLAAILLLVAGGGGSGTGFFNMPAAPFALLKALFHQVCQ